MRPGRTVRRVVRTEKMARSCSASGRALSLSPDRNFVGFFQKKKKKGLTQPNGSRVFLGVLVASREKERERAGFLVNPLFFLV